MVDFSTVVLLYTGNLGTSRDIHNKDNGCETRTGNPSVINQILLPIELTSSKDIAGKELSLSGWCIASIYIYHFSTVVNFSSGKYSGSTGHRNSWYQQGNLH